MTDNILMALGDFRFSIATAAYQTLRRENEYRWAAQDRIGREPARQWLGQGHDTITLEGVIYPAERGAGTEQITAMRNAASKGEPLILVDGTGHVWGKHVIERIEETQSHLHTDSQPRKQAFALTLAAYGDDT
ncbi:MAG: phage tail protein [Pseudomonadota bacterium]